jgi:hydrogenase large subunit
VSTYQIVSPSTFNASPRDDDGRPGPIEQALAGSPIIEEPGDDGLTGIDALRVVHSFDPCTSCATH